MKVEKGNTKFRTEFSEETWRLKYQSQDEADINDSHLRTALALAEPEENKEKWAKEFVWAQEDFKFMTGGRILSNAGIERSTTLINCFHGDTEIITRFGIKPIRELSGQDSIILTDNGQWVSAPIKCFGEQKIWKLTVKKNRQIKVILTTGDHGWLTYTKKNRKIKKLLTKDLSHVHYLKQMKPRVLGKVEFSPIGVAQGFVYGDGGGNDNWRKSCRAHFCGEKDHHLKQYFPEQTSFGLNGDTVYCDGMPNGWRRLPDLTENSSFLAGWLAGYFAADGCVSEFGECSIASTDKNNILFVKSLCSILGIRYFGEKTQDRISNLTNKQSLLYSLCLDSKDLVEKFFIIPEHKKRFLSNERERVYHWKVVSVEETDIIDNVYCATVPEKHCFTLEGNILTQNCFVDGAEGYDIDSIDGIYHALKKQALILKSEGGYGMSADFMRPHGAFIKGIANQSPGAVKFLELWDKSSEIITLGSEKKSKRKDQKNFIRKGAQMVTMSCWHPDVLRFINAKKTPGCLTKFNMSVLCTDVFMNAVVNKKPWKLVYPNYEKFPDDYKKVWNGDLAGWIDHIGETYGSTAGATVTYHKFDDANELWDLIMENTYSRNEPGVLFVDTMNRMNNLWYCEWINATNPCLARGYEVNTPEGLRKVEDIQVGDYVCTAIGSESVKTIEVHKDYPTFKVRFSDGVEQIVTGAHRYHVSKKGETSKKIQKIRVDELSVGDKVQVASCEFLNNEVEPESLSYNHGCRAGVLLGDGCYTDHCLDQNVIKISSSKDDDEYNKNIVENIFCSSYFNKEYDDKNSKAITLVMSYKKYLDSSTNEPSIEELGLTPGQKSHEKTIDYSVITNKSFAMGLLDGLLATDGNVNLKSNHPQLRWMTTSKKLAETIRNILLYIGCHGFISSSFDKSGTINGRQINRNHTKYTVTISGESFRNYAKHTCIRSVHSEKAKLIEDALINFRLSGNRWCAEIVSIEPGPKTDVYDLYCEKSDTWITSGYVQKGCGEQVLPIGAVCLLGSINLLHCVKEDGTFDYDLFKRIIHIAVRMLDNVNDVTYVPLESQRENLINKRRIGLGVLGYGSALMLMKLRYGSKKALNFTEKLMHFMTNEAYRASALLAKEKGAFPFYEEDCYLQGKFIQNLDEDVINLIKQYGIRNSHLISLQPTGNSSCLANIVTGGLEPNFAVPGYFRTAIVPHAPKGLWLPKEIDWTERSYYCPNADWEWIKEGDEDLLKIEFNGKIYKYDRNRGLTKEEWIEDHAIAILKERGEWDSEAKWACSAMDLKVDDHVKTMAIFAKWADSAISKTVNLPNNYPYKDFKDVYLKAWEAGVKGFTTYREGTMTTVLCTKSSSTNGITKTRAPDRPEVLPCDIHHITYKGTKWIVLVGVFEDDPYEVFAFKMDGYLIPEELNRGTLTKVMLKTKSRYELEIGDDLVFRDVAKCFESDEEESLTRMISTSLRHGVDIEFVIDQLWKSKGTIASFNKVIARVLKKYINADELKVLKCSECGSKNLEMREGCFACRDCGMSKCE